MKTITGERIEQIKSEMQKMYDQMQELGMIPNCSSVVLEFIDRYNHAFQWSETGTIATMAEVAQETVDSEPMTDYWDTVGLYELPDQIIFSVYDHNNGGEGNLIVSLRGDYISFMVLDEELNELTC